MKLPLQINIDELTESVNAKGFVVLPNLLTPNNCELLMGRYENQSLYRTTINMQRYRFGKGEYKYYNYPLPEVIQNLRQGLYEPLAKIANQWMNCLGIQTTYPVHHSEFIKNCHQQNQFRPTPLILKYEAGGFNTLHQDLYGEVYFPFQIIFALTQEGKDHTGGELVFTEQIPRAQSKATVIKLNQGDGVVITTNFRPVPGTRGYYRANVKHGVSEIKSGTRFSLGIVFHDAA